jgi:hypothetical protein
MKSLMTKEEIGRYLSPKEPLSERSVQRYIALANEQLPEGEQIRAESHGRGGAGNVAKYRREDVEKIKAAYVAATEKREQGSAALAVRQPDTLAPVALAAQIAESSREAFRALSAALDVWPVWMTRAEAIERTGLPASWFDEGARAGKLAHIGEGRGRRFHRDDVRAFAESFKA